MESLFNKDNLQLMEDQLRKGKKIQLEFNKKENCIKMLLCKMQKIKLEK